MSDLEHAIQEAKKLAQTPDGKQLAAMLQQLGGPTLQKALETAANGDLTLAKQSLSALLNDPQARQLLERLGNSYGK